jgi:mercuric transport protein
MKKQSLVSAVAVALVLALGAVGVSAATQTVTIKVEGMHCGGCSSSVTKALKATEGVEDAQVDFQKGEAVVKYDDQKVTVAKLREVISKTGFKVVEDKTE